MITNDATNTPIQTTEAAPHSEVKKVSSRTEIPGIVKRANSYFADPRTIRRKPGFNPRFDFGDVRGLADSIKANGLLQPLRVKRVTDPSAYSDATACFELIDGDRRLTAIEMLLDAGEVFEEGVPVVIVDKKQDLITDLLQMFAANDGKPFLPLEEAVAYKRMRGAGMTIKDICKAVGRATPHVNSILALADADESLKQAVKEGKINKTLAKDIATNARDDKAKQAELTAAAVAAGGDRGAKRKVVRATEEAKQKKAIKRGRIAPKMRALSDEELSTLGASVAARLPKLIKDANAGKYEDDLGKWIALDEKMALAFTFGALQALKAAAGIHVNLEV